MCRSYQIFWQRASVPAIGRRAIKLQAKKEWQIPELIILVRSKPEEAVLVLNCKEPGEKLRGSVVYQSRCNRTGSLCCECYDAGTY